MDLMVRLILLVIFLQANIQLGYTGVEHLTFKDQKCFPYDFAFHLEERKFVRLLVVPFLGIESIKDLSRLDIINDNNMRHNEFLSCMWRDRGFQNQDGSINFQKIEHVLAHAIGEEVGGTGPGINLSKVEAARIVGECNNLGGITRGQKVVFVRNCVLQRIKGFGTI